MWAFDSGRVAWLIRGLDLEHLEPVQDMGEFGLTSLSSKVQASDNNQRLHRLVSAVHQGCWV